MIDFKKGISGKILNSIIFINLLCWEFIFLNTSPWSQMAITILPLKATTI